MAAEPTLWCPRAAPNTGRHDAVPRLPRRARARRRRCSTTTTTAGSVELGEWPRVQAQVLRRRLETAGVSVMIEWSGPASDATGILLVPEDQAEFGAAVVNEIDVDDEVADNSPHAYVARIEEHLSAAAGLLAELRTQLDELEADGRL